MRPAMIWTVLHEGRMVHYGTDRVEAEMIARLQGCELERVVEDRWYSQAALVGRGDPGWVHPADRDMAREWRSWERRTLAADEAGEAAPRLNITGQPILEGQLVE